MFCLFQVGFLICDPTVAKPDLLKDKFWDSVIPSQLPYTKVVSYLADFPAVFFHISFGICHVMEPTSYTKMLHLH